MDPLAILIAVVALTLLPRFKTNSAWLVIAGGAIGLAARNLFG